MYLRPGWPFSQHIHNFPLPVVPREPDEVYYTPHLIDNILGLTKRKEFHRTQQENKTDTQEDEKKTRTSFTPSQISRLEQDFIQKKYLTSAERIELANELGLTQQQVDSDILLKILFFMKAFK